MTLMTLNSEAKDVKRDYEAIATRIVELISATGLRPGDRLPTERALSVQLEVSRGTVRDAVKVLSAGGLVQSRQGSGLYVTGEASTFAQGTIDLSMTVDPEHILSLFEFREANETRVAQLAAERATPRHLKLLKEAVKGSRNAATHEDPVLFRSSDEAFHQTLADAAQNPFFYAAIGSILRMQNLAIDTAAGRTPGSMQLAAEQHLQILEAVRDADSDSARVAMQEHLTTARENYRQEMRRALEKL